MNAKFINDLNLNINNLLNFNKFKNNTFEKK